MTTSVANFFFNLFWITLAVNLAGEWLQHEQLRFFSKPLLMIFLTAGFFLKTAVNRTFPQKLILAALVFSWMGDMFLMFTNISENYFLFGLVAFLIAHVFYIISFKKETQKIPGKKLLQLKPYFGIPVFIIFGTLMAILFPKVQPEMKAPVLIYASVITVMVLTAMNRWKKVNYGSFWFVIIGASLFMLSDSLIAINKFGTEINRAGFYIMLLYGVGQFLIAKGAIKNLK